MKFATVVICCFMLAVSASEDQTHEVNNLVSSSSGMLFNRVYDALFVHDEWRIVAYTDTEHYDKKMADMERSHVVVEKLCAVKGCQSGKRMNFLYRTATEKSSTYRQMTAGSSDSTPHVISGLVNGDVADKINQAIENFDNDQHKYMEDQLLVTDAAISHANATTETFVRLNELYEKNVKLADDLEANKDKIKNDPEVGRDIDDHVHAIMLISLELDKEFSALIGSIDYVQKGMLHPEVMTAPTFLDELTKTGGEKKATKFAYPLTKENTHNLLRLVKMSGFFYKNKLVFVLHVPTVQGLEYDLYEILPMPVKGPEDSFLYIMPTTRYLALDKKFKIHYVTMDCLKQCVKTSPSSVLCKMSDVYSSMGKPTCETKLLLGGDKMTSIPEGCDVRVTPNPLDIFHRLDNSNSWVFVKSKPESGEIGCRQPIHGGHNDEKLTLSDSGVISMKPRCIFYGQTTFLIPKKYDLGGFTADISMPKISGDKCCTAEIVKETLMGVNHRNLDNIGLEDLHRVSYKVKKPSA